MLASAAIKPQIKFTTTTRFTVQLQLSFYIFSRFHHLVYHNLAVVANEQALLCWLIDLNSHHCKTISLEWTIFFNRFRSEISNHRNRHCNTTGEENRKRTLFHVEFWYKCNGKLCTWCIMKTWYKDKQKHQNHWNILTSKVQKNTAATA